MDDWNSFLDVGMRGERVSDIEPAPPPAVKSPRFVAVVERIHADSYRSITSHVYDRRYRKRRWWTVPEPFRDFEAWLDWRRRLLDVGHLMVRAGLQPFPLAPYVPGAAGKRPLMANWQDRLWWKPAAVDKWLANPFEREIGLGLYCGERIEHCQRHLVVGDYDVKKDPEGVGLRRAGHELGIDLLGGPHQATPTGGFHVLFGAPFRVRSRPTLPGWAGWEFKGAWSLVVLAPSIHPTRALPYELRNGHLLGSIPDLPMPWLELANSVDDQEYRRKLDDVREGNARKRWSESTTRSPSPPSPPPDSRGSEDPGGVESVLASSGTGTRAIRGSSSKARPRRLTTAEQVELRGRTYEDLLDWAIRYAPVDRAGGSRRARQTARLVAGFRRAGVPKEAIRSVTKGWYDHFQDQIHAGWEHVASDVDGLLDKLRAQPRPAPRAPAPDHQARRLERVLGIGLPSDGELKAAIKVELSPGRRVDALDVDFVGALLRAVLDQTNGRVGGRLTMTDEQISRLARFVYHPQRVSRLKDKFIDRDSATERRARENFAQIRRPLLREVLKGIRGEDGPGEPTEYEVTSACESLLRRLFGRTAGLDVPARVAAIA